MSKFGSNILDKICATNILASAKTNITILNWYNVLIEDVCEAQVDKAIESSARASSALTES